MNKPWIYFWLLDLDRHLAIFLQIQFWAKSFGTSRHRAPKLVLFHSSASVGYNLMVLNFFCDCVFFFFFFFFFFGGGFLLEVGMPKVFLSPIFCNSIGASDWFNRRIAFNSTNQKAVPTKP